MRHHTRERNASLARFSGSRLGSHCGSQVVGGGGLAAARVYRAVLADWGPVGGGAGADVGARGPGGRDNLGVAVGAGARGYEDEPVAADAEAAGDRGEALRGQRERQARERDAAGDL